MEMSDKAVSIYNKINEIENKENKNFIIYPYGNIGRLTKKILNEHFKIMEKYVLDTEGKKIGFLNEIDTSLYTVLLACDNSYIYEEILESITQYVPRYNIVELFPRITVGKYSYGSLCNKVYGIESIGAFCSFAVGVEIVGNHDVYISSHEFLSYPGDWKRAQSCVPFIDKIAKPRVVPKVKIENDVWIGRNAIILAGCHIGNGAIVGAGAVVTKDIPDYAIVVGVPAKVIRYRYTQEQIKKMNQIAWWNWPDEKIKENYEDFYLDIDTFLKKHYEEG